MFEARCASRQFQRPTHEDRGNQRRGEVPRRAILLALLLGICYRHFRCGSGFRARPFHVNETALSECIILTELTADAMAGSTGFSSRHLKDLGGFDESIDLSRDR